MSEERCDRCRYWKALGVIDSRLKAEDGQQGLCRRFPPAVLHEEKARGVWTITLSSQRCGEFKATE